MGKIKSNDARFDELLMHFWYWKSFSLEEFSQRHLGASTKKNEAQNATRSFTFTSHGRLWKEHVIFVWEHTITLPFSSHRCFETGSKRAGVVRKLASSFPKLGQS